MIAARRLFADVETAAEIAREIRLLTRRRIKMLFPTAEIRHERVVGLSKSLIAVI